MNKINSNSSEDIGALRLKIEELKKENAEKEWGILKTNEGIKILYKDLEQKNRELQKLDQLKSDFVSTVSHELRTPLTIVKESIAQMKEGVLGDVNDEQLKHLSMAFNNVDRLGRIIDDLLDISKLEAGKFDLNREEFDLTEVASEIKVIFEKLLANKGLKMETKFSNDEITVFADRDKILQVYTNLVSNAIKFTEEGHIELQIEDKGETVECSVNDTGVGFSKEDLPKVFEKFQQFGRKVGPGEKGTGLGTAICKGIVSLHKGDIWVESEEGKGSRFIFMLPKKYVEPKKENVDN